MADPVTLAPAMTLTDQLPILQTVIPMLSAPIIVLLGSRMAAWWIAFIASLCTLACAYLLLIQVMPGGFISYQLGGWAPPLGIEYRVDAANALILFLICLLYTSPSPRDA